MEFSVPLRVSTFPLVGLHTAPPMSARGIRFECCIVVRRALMSFSHCSTQNMCRAMLEFALPMLRRIFVRAGRSCSAVRLAKSPVLGLPRRDYGNLTTVDLVCHGVPSGRMFADCVEDYGKQLGSPVVDFRFRCKREDGATLFFFFFFLRMEERSPFLRQNPLLRHVPEP